MNADSKLIFWYGKVSCLPSCAGRFIPRIEGCYFNVVGLPLARLQHALTEFGWSED